MKPMYQAGLEKGMEHAAAAAAERALGPKPTANGKHKTLWCRPAAPAAPPRVPPHLNAESGERSHISILTYHSTEKLTRQRCGSLSHGTYSVRVLDARASYCVSVCACAVTADREHGFESISVR